MEIHKRAFFKIGVNVIKKKSRVKSVYLILLRSKRRESE